MRLAKFFNMKPEYWLNLQTQYDLARAASDAKLKKLINSIPIGKEPSAADKKITASARKGAKKTVN
jgi:plasmid maintenance system antidote protein VapI